MPQDDVPAVDWQGNTLEVGDRVQYGADPSKLATVRELEWDVIEGEWIATETIFATIQHDGDDDTEVIRGVPSAVASDPVVEFDDLEKLRTCDHCGETLSLDTDRAELAGPEPDSKHVLVHAEPCGTHLLAHGWEIA